MNKLRFLIIFFTAFLFVVSFSGSAFAKDTPSNSRPGVTYGSYHEFSYNEVYGPLPVNRWTPFATAYRYHSWDKDTFHAVNARANITLSSTSTSTYTRSGSTKFGFKNFAEINMGGSHGTTWGKTSTVNFDAAAGYSYELWSANKIHVKKYIYREKGIFGGITNHRGELWDRDGTVKWFFRYR